MITMTENEKLKAAIHCLGYTAEQEVCEECSVYREGGIACREVARVAISALEEIQRYRAIGTVEVCRENVVAIAGYDEKLFLVAVFFIKVFHEKNYIIK